MITLGCRTDYSFLRGYGTAKQWLARCEEIGIEALAITDYQSTWGHVAFWDVFKKSKVKLIYGVQLAVVAQLEKDPSHDLVTILAKNSAGLAAIYGAVATAQEQTYYRPRLDVSFNDRRGFVDASIDMGFGGKMNHGFTPAHRRFDR